MYANPTESLFFKELLKNIERKAVSNTLSDANVNKAVRHKVQFGFILLYTKNAIYLDYIIMV